MISKLKLGIKMLKFGHGIKSTLIGAVLAQIVGLAVCGLNIYVASTSDVHITFPGGYFFALGSIFLVQLLYSVSMSNMVQASPRKKELQTSVPAVISVFSMLAGYLIVVIMGAIMICLRPERVPYVCGQLLFSVVMMVSIMIYTSVCYKYFAVATILFLLIFVSSYSYIGSENGWEISFFESNWATFALMAVLGAAAIVVSGFLQYLLSLAVYKAPMSKRAMAGSLREQL